MPARRMAAQMRSPSTDVTNAMRLLKAAGLLSRGHETTENKASVTGLTMRSSSEHGQHR